MSRFHLHAGAHMLERTQPVLLTALVLIHSVLLLSFIASVTAAASKHKIIPKVIRG